MNECEYCGDKEEAPNMRWTENMRDLVCICCHDLLIGMQSYKNIFKVEYVMKKQFPRI